MTLSYKLIILMIFYIILIYNKTFAHKSKQGSCTANHWSAWSKCTWDCGSAGIQRRSRTLIHFTPGYRCPLPLEEKRNCNRFCYNKGSMRIQGCACPKPFFGRCCQFRYDGEKPQSTRDTTFQTGDPCKDYTKEDNYQRSTAFILPKNSKVSLNDRKLAAGWYRFTSGAGGKMPTQCPPDRSCGSLAPVYLDGDNHPSNVGDVAESETCIRSSKKCCAQRGNKIQIRKCSENGEEFFVYYLRKTSGELINYCAGTEKKCEEGETSKTGFTPDCSSQFPKIKKHPEVTVDVKDKRIRFKCKSFPEDTSDNVYHEVTWYQSPPEKQIKLPTQVLENGETEAFLQNNNSFGEKPLFCLGHEIYCKVKSYYKDKKIPSPIRWSNQFFAGYKVEPRTLDLSEKDKPQKVTITNTVPIVCQDGLENCNTIIEVGQTKTDTFVDYCTLRFKPGPRGQTKEIEVVAKRDFVDDGNQEMFLNLYVPSHVNPVDWNCHKNITDFKVITKDVKTSRCTSTGDPHIRTFDGLYYNHFSVGDYILVKSNARNFEIHVRTWICHTVSCNCGIAVKEGDDVVVVDMCRDRVPRARFASTVEPQPGTRITRNDNGKSFVLDFPSGAYVKFTSKRWFGRWYFADFEIQLPSDDYKNTSGLCGTFDGNRNNDMTDRNGNLIGNKRGRTAPTAFTESWKINVGKSLFYYKATEKKCLATRAKSYCTCKETCCSKRSIHCDFQGYSERPKYRQGFRGWKELTFPGAEHCGRRKRRSVGDDVIVLPDDGESAVYTYDYPTGFVPNEGGWPTRVNRITEQMAKDHCRKTIEGSKIAITCKKLIAGFDLTEYIEQCVTDVKILDSKKAASDSAINTVTSICEEKTLREIKTFWKKDDSGQIAPPVEVGDSACPNECNGNGNCVNATCICNKDYITDDCSMKKGQAPVLLGIPSNGLCDIRNRDCIRSRVTGYDFIDSPTLSCRMQEVKISANSPEKIGQIYTDKADMLSFGEISCLLPNVPVNIMGNPKTSHGKPVGGFYLKISNDGKTFSNNESLVIIYDSKCMQCNLKGSCIWKQNSCKVSDYCFAPGDPNPNDWCEVCDPNVNREGFVKRKVNAKPYFLDVTLQHIFKGQLWKFSVPAKDQDMTPLKYSFVGESHNMKISSAGILTWKPVSIGTFSFRIKVEDPCGETAERDFEVQTHQCKCEGKNGGQCKWTSQPGDVNNTVCECPDGCQGDTCLEAVEGRVCKIYAEQIQEDDDGSDTALIVLLVLFFVVILVVLLIGIYVVRYLKKRKQSFSKDNVKEATLSLGKDAKKKMTETAVKAYNQAHHVKDKNVKVKYYNGEDGSQVNPGYEG